MESACVPEMSLVSRTGLEQILTPGKHGRDLSQPGVTLALREDLALAAIMCRKGKVNDLQNCAQEKFGVALPMNATRVTSGSTSFAWSGPDRWLGATSQSNGTSFERSLRELFFGLASVVDQSDSRAIVRIGGPKARDALAKGLPIDLDARAFGPGDTALTLAGHINVQLWQIDSAPTYEFAVFRSFAASFCEWLIEASSSFGVIVQSHR
jgi:methylglutamate dehydrogenase subunit D